jgi:hypothetical protein
VTHSDAKSAAADETRTLFGTRQPRTKFRRPSDDAPADEGTIGASSIRRRFSWVAPGGGAVKRGGRLAVVCPVTNTVRWQLWEVPIPNQSGATAVILSDQVKSLDWGEAATPSFSATSRRPPSNKVTYRIATLIGA